MWRIISTFIYGRVAGTNKTLYYAHGAIVTSGDHSGIEGWEATYLVLTLPHYALCSWALTLVT